MTERVLKENEVAIDKDTWDSMIDDVMWLSCLEQAGVDNWSGCVYAHELYNAKGKTDG